MKEDEYIVECFNGSDWIALLGAPLYWDKALKAAEAMRLVRKDEDVRVIEADTGLVVLDA
jgi:hypothetical protein